MIPRSVTLESQSTAGPLTSIEELMVSTPSVITDSGTNLSLRTVLKRWHATLHVEGVFKARQAICHTTAHKSFNRVDAAVVCVAQL